MLLALFLFVLFLTVRTYVTLRRLLRQNGIDLEDDT